MIVDKVIWTDEDRKTLQDIEDSWEQITEDTEGEELYNLFMLLNAKHKKLIEDIEQRYLDSFGGDQEAIIADIQEIVSALELVDFQRFYRTNKARYREILAEKPQKPKYKSGELKPHHQENGETIYMFEKLPTEKEDTSEQYKLYQAAKLLASASFEGCRNFILSFLIDVQLRGLDEEHKEQAAKIAEDKAAEWYKRPKRYAPIKDMPLPVLFTEEIQEHSGDMLFRVPSTPITQNIRDLLGSARSPELFSQRKALYNPNALIDFRVDKDKNRLEYVYKKGEEIISVRNTDLDKLLKTKPTLTKKIFDYAMAIAYLSGTISGFIPTRPYITFSLDRFMKDFNYKSMDTAWQGFYNGTDALTDIKVSGKRQKQGKHVQLFPAAKIKNSVCIIKLAQNEDFDWSLITRQYTRIPGYYFSIDNDRAAELLRYIWNMARQHTKDIREKGCFYISYRAIQTQLQLKDETKTKNPGRDIKEVIENAVVDIMDTHLQYDQPNDKNEYQRFQLVMDTSVETAPIKEYLDKGRLKVIFKGAYAEPFKKISDHTAARVKKNQKQLKS